MSRDADDDTDIDTRVIRLHTTGRPGPIAAGVRLFHQGDLELGPV